MSDEQAPTRPEPSEAETSEHEEASEHGAEAPPIGEPVPPVHDGGASPPTPPPPSGPPSAAASRWSRPSGLPVLTLALGALLIGVLAFAFGVFAGRSSADAPGRGWIGGGDRGALAPGMPGSGAMPGGGAMPGMPGGGVMPGMPGMPGVGTGGEGAAPGNRAITAGTVTGVDGQTIVVESIRGNTVTVHTSDATSIRIVRDEDRADDPIAEGDDIVVAGTPGEEALTIEAIRIVAGDLPWIRSLEGADPAGGSTGTTT